MGCGVVLDMRRRWKGKDRSCEHSHVRRYPTVGGMVVEEMVCPLCGKPIGEDMVRLCARCEVGFALDLSRLMLDLRPLHDMLDATVHYGGHEPARTQTATPPTPIRLNVLDLIEDITDYAYELHRILEGATLDGEHALEDVVGTLLSCVESERLAVSAHADRWARHARRMAAQADLLLDPPDLHPIGHCPNQLCGVMLNASDGQETVTCGVCGTTCRVADIRMHTLYKLCWDGEHVAGAAQIARIFTDCGIPLRRNTISQWAARGKLQNVGIVGARPVYRYADVYRLASSATKK